MQFFYLLCSQFRQKASSWINKTLLLVKQHKWLFEFCVKIHRVGRVTVSTHIFFLASSLFKLSFPNCIFPDTIFQREIIGRKFLHCTVNIGVICVNSVWQENPFINNNFMNRYWLSNLVTIPWWSIKWFIFYEQSYNLIKSSCCKNAQSTQML